MTVTTTEEKIKSAVQEGVKEAMRSELMKIRALLVPSVSEEEQKDIDKRYIAPQIEDEAKTLHLDV
jgi:hypothetical protein